MPDFVFFFDEEFFCFAESFERLRGLAFLTEGDRLIDERFRGFVADFEFAEELIAVMSDVVNFGAEIELDVDVGKIEVAKSDEIFVADLVASDARAF